MVSSFQKVLIVDAICLVVYGVLFGCSMDSAITNTGTTAHVYEFGVDIHNSSHIAAEPGFAVNVLGGTAYVAILGFVQHFICLMITKFEPDNEELRYRTQVKVHLLTFQYWDYAFYKPVLFGSLAIMTGATVTPTLVLGVLWQVYHAYNRWANERMRNSAIDAGLIPDVTMLFSTVADIACWAIVLAQVDTFWDNLNPGVKVASILCCVCCFLEDAMHLAYNYSNSLRLLYPHTTIILQKFLSLLTRTVFITSVIWTYAPKMWGLPAF